MWNHSSTPRHHTCQPTFSTDRRAPQGLLTPRLKLQRRTHGTRQNQCMPTVAAFLLLPTKAKVFVLWSLERQPSWCRQAGLATLSREEAVKCLQVSTLITTTAPWEVGPVTSDSARHRTSQKLVGGISFRLSGRLQSTARIFPLPGIANVNRSCHQGGAEPFSQVPTLLVDIDNGVP